ncbi:MAG: hypothetical protein MUO40_04725 [Anaerolineaceae bacterium]|nr:hypothetical protein [Anaerolineaceae bacterium]
MLFTPYQNEGLDILYNLAFCDDLSLFKENYHGEVQGIWQSLFSESTSNDDLRKIAHDHNLETRLRILAYKALNKCGQPEPEKELLGVIVEVGLEKGLDMLAAYIDHRARYINQSGKVIIWELEDPIVDALIDELFSAARQVWPKIGPWEQPRLAPPPKGAMRLTFLVSDGLYFGQGDILTLQNDPLGGAVVASGTKLLQELLSKID